MQLHGTPDGALLRRRQALLYSQGLQQEAGAKAPNAGGEAGMSSLNLLEAEQQRGEMHAKLLRERVARLEALAH